MALVRYPPYDRRYDGENGTEKVEAFVDTSTGQIFNNKRQGDSENGFTYAMFPTEMKWDWLNTADSSGKNIFGSQGYVPEEYTLYGDESGDSWGATGKAGITPSGDIQIGQSLEAKGYNDVLNKYGIQPKYDPEYGYVLPSNVHNAVTQEYFRNYGLGEYGSRGGITGFLDNYAVPLMMAATGAGMAGLGGAAAEGAAATEGALATAAPVADTAATAETAAAAGDAYLPGALSNPLTQAMPTVSNLAQAAATNAGMQLATTGTIDPEKVLESVVTGAAGSTLGNLAGIAAGNAAESNLVRSIVSGAVSGATQAAINGTDPITAALASGAASGLGYEVKANDINVPQQSINAVVNSIATGAPLEKTLLSAAMSMGVGAAKDVVSNISLTDTQAPAPVETRTPISPLPADSGNVTTAELSDTSPSGYYASGSDVPVNADGSIYSSLSATGGGTNVAASNLPINIETQPEGYFDSEGAFRPLYKQADGSLKNESGDTVNQQGDIIKALHRGFWGTTNYGNTQPTGLNVATTNPVTNETTVLSTDNIPTTTTALDVLLSNPSTTSSNTIIVDNGDNTSSVVNLNTGSVDSVINNATGQDVTAANPTTSGLDATAAVSQPTQPSVSDIAVNQPVSGLDSAAVVSQPTQPSVADSTAVINQPASGLDAATNVAQTGSTVDQVANNTATQGTINQVAANTITGPVADASSPSGYYASGTTTPVKADGSIWTPIDAASSGTNVAANTTGNTVVDTGNPIVEAPRNITYKSLAEAQADPRNSNKTNITVDSDGNIYGVLPNGEEIGLGKIDTSTGATTAVNNGASMGDEILIQDNPIDSTPNNTSGGLPSGDVGSVNDQSATLNSGTSANTSAAQNYATTQQIQDAIANIQFPAGITQEQVTSSIASYLNAHPTLNATDVANAIAGYMQEYPPISAADVNSAITNATQGLATRDDISNAIAGINFPEGITNADVTSAISNYMDSHPTLNAADVANTIASYMENNPPLNVDDVSAAITNATQGFATSADVLGGLNTLATDFQNQLAASDATTQAAFANMTSSQQAETLARVQQGQDLKSSISDVQTALGNQITGGLASLSTEFQTQLAASDATTQAAFNALTTAQQQEAADRVQQGADLKTSIADVQSNLGGQITGVQSGLESLSNTVQSNQDALNSTLATMTASQQAEVANRVSMGISLQDAISGVSSSLSSVQSILTNQIQANENSGMARDAAINAALDTVSADVGTTRQNLLDQLGTTAEQLSSSFTNQLADVQSGLTGQITSGLSTLGSQMATNLSAAQDLLTQRIQANETAGMARDVAIDNAINTVSANVGTTRAELLNELGQTEDSLRELYTQGQTQNATDIFNLSTNLSGQISSTNQTMQERFDALTADQRDQALTLAQTTGDLSSAIDEVSADVAQNAANTTTQFQNLTNAVGTQIGNVNTQISGLSGNIANVATAQQQTAAAQQQAAADQLAAQKKAAADAANNTLMAYKNPDYAYLQPGMINTGKANQSAPLFTGLDPKLVSLISRAKGGSVHPNLQRVLIDRGYDVNPVDFVEGPEDRMYMRHAKRGFAVNGPGTGQSDDIPTMLADGEYVFDADTVAAIGDGSSKAGAAALDKMREEIRKHKRSAPVDKIPPKAKSPLDYLKMANKGK